MIVEYNINILLWLVVKCSSCRIFLPIFIHVTCAMDAVIWGNVEYTPYSANHDYKLFMKAKLQVIIEEDLFVRFSALFGNCQFQLELKLSVGEFS